MGPIPISPVPCSPTYRGSTVLENLSLYDFITVSTYIFEQLERKQWPGNYLGNSLLSKP